MGIAPKKPLLPRCLTGRSLAFGLAKLALSAVLATQRAWADLTVRMPDIDFHAIDFEHDDLVPLGHKGAALSGLQSYVNAVGYAALPFWEIELVGNLQAGSGQRLNWEATSLENTFQIVKEGDRFPVALALYTEYTNTHRHEEADSITFGPIIQAKLHDVLGMGSVSIR